MRPTTFNGSWTRPATTSCRSRRSAAGEPPPLPSRQVSRPARAGQASPRRPPRLPRPNRGARPQAARRREEGPRPPSAPGAARTLLRQPAGRTRWDCSASWRSSGASSVPPRGTGGDSSRPRTRTPTRRSPTRRPTPHPSGLGWLWRSYSRGTSLRNKAELARLKAEHPNAAGRLAGKDGPFATTLQTLIDRPPSFPTEATGDGEWTAFAGSAARDGRADRPAAVLLARPRRRGRFAFPTDRLRDRTVLPRVAPARAVRVPPDRARRRRLRRRPGARVRVRPEDRGSAVHLRHPAKTWTRPGPPT